MFQYVLTRRTTKHVGRYNQTEGTIFNNNKGEICSSLHMQATKQRETRSCTRVSPETKLFIYLGFYVAFNTVQVISRRVVGRARGNQYTQLVRVLYRKLPTNGKQLPAFPLEAVPGIEPPASEVGGKSVNTLPPWPPGDTTKATCTNGASETART